jgi:hypothetical protein
MSVLRVYKILVVVIAIALFVPACGPSQREESTISTAVAQTVQAGESLTKVSILPTATQTSEALSTETTLTPAVTLTNAPALVSAPADPNCAKGSLVAENPPDQTILTPGEYFWKTWTLQNTGTCTWTTAYQLVFWDGDRLGSSLSYGLTNDVAPGENIDISIYLQAPDTGGTFTGFWRIKTPWESNFGVGQYDAAISTSIVVGSITPESRRTETVFGITSVTYTFERRCGLANTFYTITASISSNGPVDAELMWFQSDGNNDRNISLTFTEAATKTVQREWAHYKYAAPAQEWVQVIVTSPTYREFDKVPIPEYCYFKP